MSQIKPENKLCWFCTQFGYTEASGGYSEYTPGEDFSICCYKRHWNFSPYQTTQEEFGKMLSTARTCPDFIPLRSLTK